MWKVDTRATKHRGVLESYLGTEECLVVPEAHDGWSIRYLGEYAVKENRHIKFLFVGGRAIKPRRGAFSYCVNLEEAHLRGFSMLAGTLFKGCQSLRRVEFPEELLTIPYGCFQDCTSLEEIRIPEGVRIIEASAFQGCTALKRVYLPASLRYVGPQAFMGCSALESFILGHGNEYFTVEAGLLLNRERKVLYAAPSGVPWGCLDLGQFPELERIGCSAFQNCAGLQELVLPKSLLHIEDRAFMDSNLSLIYGLEEVQSIGEYAFSGTRLSSLELPDTLKVLQQGAFDSCKELRVVVFPDSLAVVPSNCCRECWNLTEVYFGAYLFEIAPRAFYGCSNLTMHNLRETRVRAIGEEAFYACRSLEAVEFPETIFRIWDRAFYGCPDLTRFVVPVKCLMLGGNIIDTEKHFVLEEK